MATPSNKKFNPLDYGAVPVANVAAKAVSSDFNPAEYGATRVAEPKSALQNVMTGAKKVAGFLTSSERNFGESIAGAVLPNTKAGKQFEQAQTQANQANDDFINIVSKRLKLKKARGEDTSKEIEQLRNAGAFKGPDSEEFNPVLKKTTKQVLGEALGVAADIASFGTYGNAVKGAQAGKFLPSAAQKVIPTATTRLQAFGQGALKVGAESVATGAAFGASQAMQENAELPTIVKRALTSGVVSGAIGGALGGLANIRNRTPESIKQSAIESYKKGLGATKEKYKEQADKIIPELLDKKEWGTYKTLVKKAESGIKLSEQEYEKLGELQGTIDSTDLLSRIDDEIGKYSQGGRALTEKTKMVDETINNHLSSSQMVLKELDPAKVAANGGMPDLISRTKTNIVDQLRRQGATEIGDILDNMDISKFDSVDEYGRAIQKEVAENLKRVPVSVNSSRVSKLKDLKNDIASLHLFNAPKEVYQQDLRKLAQQYGEVLYDTRKSIKTVEDSATLSQVRKIDIAIRDLLNTKNPEYSKINKVYSLNSRMMEILEETARRKEARPLISWFNAITGGTGATVGSTIGFSVGGPAGSALGGLIGGVLAVGVTSALNSTWYNTMRAVQKTQLAEKIARIGSLEGAKYWIKVLNTQGINGANKLLATPEEDLDRVPE